VRELNTIQSEVNRLFNSLFDGPAAGSAITAHRRWIPAMDLVENESEFVLKADLPGLTEADVKVEISVGGGAIEAGESES
jgi:HSP20 family protein